MPKKKKPLSHSHCVSWVAEQEANMGTLDGHLAQGKQGPRPSDEENVPGETDFKNCSQSG